MSVLSNHFPRALMSGVALLAVCPLSPASAQERSAADSTIIVTGEREAEESYKVSESRSGMRTDTALVDTPQSVSVVTARQIEDQAANSIGDAIRYTPGVYSAQGEGNRETLVIRGMTTTGDFYIDGIRDDVQTYRDLYNIQRLEVFRGPNAMSFGRGGTGGLINRVTKVAGWNPVRDVRLEAGMYDHYRGSLDIGNAVSDSLAVRLTGVYQDSGSYRDGVDYQRWGINPTVAARIGPNTLIEAGYEHFHDERVADRGVPSQLTSNAIAEPLDTPRGQFFGNSEQSPSWTNSDAVNLHIRHDFASGLVLANRTRYAEYDKFYQNVFTVGLNPTALTNSGTILDAPGMPAGTYAPGSLAGIQAYNNATGRKNFINQTDLNAEFATGSVRHTLLVGAELGRQETENLREVGYFSIGGGAQEVQRIYAPVTAPHIVAPLAEFQPSGTGGGSFATLDIAGFYVQDQVRLTSQLEIVLGARYEHLVTEVVDRGAASPSTIRAVDDLWSPRAGLIYKPVENASIYASFSRSYLPRGGDQLAGLNINNQSLAPERYSNYELGAKWDINPRFNISAAVYQLDRDNVLVLIDPSDPSAGTELAGGQRSRGFELGFAGRVVPALSLVGSYTYQDAKFTRSLSATVQEGARIPNAPRHSAALWGKYEVSSNFALALGASYQGERFASQDNSVRLPAYTRLDAAAYYKLGENIDLQLNVENLLDEHYFQFAHSNANITPGGPTSVRGAINIRF